MEAADGWHVGAGGTDKPPQSTSHRLIRKSSQATDADQPLVDQGAQEAYSIGMVALSIAERRWKTGGCIAIQAKSPSRVAPGARSQIPVKVTHRFEGSEVAARLRTELSGGKPYHLEGGADEFHGAGLVCDLSQPFEASGSGVTVKFAPSSDRAGIYTYSGNISGFGVSGNGTYTVTYNGDVATGLHATGPGSVQTPRGVVTGNGTEEYTLTKEDDSACP